MILDEIKDVAKAVLGSGLPDSLFKEESPVYEQMKTVGTILDITPRQVVMLSVAIHIGSRSVNRRTIARFCEITEDVIMTYKWDMMTLCIKGYLNFSEPFPSHYVFCLPYGLTECWRNGKAYHTGICPSRDSKYNRDFLADAVFRKVLLPYWAGKETKSGTEVRRYLQGLLFEFENLSLCSHLRMVCHEKFCPSPALGKHIILLLIANTLHPVRERSLGKEEVQLILFGTPTEEENAEFFCTLDFLLKTDHLEYNGKSLRLTGILWDWVAGDLNMDLIIPYENV